MYGGESHCHDAAAVPTDRCLRRALKTEMRAETNDEIMPAWRPVPKLGPFEIGHKSAT